MRKCIAIILAFFSVLGMYAIGQAKPLYEQYWEPGAYTVEITEEDQVRLAALREQVEMLSAGTKVREASEAETLEVQYEKYLQMGEIPERVYDDVGPFTWAAGLPDEEAISQEEAYIRACMVLAAQYDLQPEQLIHYWQHYAYVTSDPENPVWQIDFICYDGTQHNTATVALHAHDGSVCGIQYEMSNG